MGAAGEDPSPPPPPPPPPPPAARRSSRTRTKPAWLAECDVTPPGTRPRRDQSRDGARGGVVDTNNPDSGEGEGTVRRRLTAAAAFQREEGETVKRLEAVTESPASDQATAASPNTGTSCLRIKDQSTHQSE